MEMGSRKLILVSVVIVVVVVGIYLWQKRADLIAGDSENVSTSTYPIPMGATNAPDPTALSRVSREKIDNLLNVLKQGQTSDQVLELQTELQKLGYIINTWKPTRFYGTVTAGAVAKYKASKK